MEYVGTLARPPFWIGGGQWLIALVSVVLLSVQLGLTRAVRTALVGEDGPGGGGPGAPPPKIGVGEAFKLSFSRYLQVFANIWLVGLAISIGLLFCILPGLAVMFFVLGAPYLVASCGDNAWNGFIRSFKLTARQFVPVIILFVILTGLIGIGIGIGFGTLGALATHGRWVFFGVRVGMQAVMLPIGYLLWVLITATYVTIETADSGVEVKR